MKAATLTEAGNVIPLRDYHTLSQWLASACRESDALLAKGEIEAARELLQAALITYHSPSAMSA